MAATTLIDRALIRLSGEDLRGFLQGLVTNDMALLVRDRPLWAGLLTAQGKALFDFILWADGEDVLVDCERAAADGLMARLKLYRLRRPIRIAPEEQLRVHWAANLNPLGLSLSKPCFSSALDEGGSAALRQAQGERVITDPRLSELGWRWLGPPDEPAQGWLEHRDKTLWLECNAAELNGVSFTKGCYVGQENTARMNYRSKVNRRLVVVPTDAPGERTRIHYPELGLAVEHRRVENLGNAIIPAWLEPALSAKSAP
jgi:tRNA-modifying protein YgfZ